MIYYTTVQKECQTKQFLNQLKIRQSKHKEQ
nr:MAG TPA: hypothetical protein [Caudoviricetes sp.]